jgi:hypothetical protein
MTSIKSKTTLLTGFVTGVALSLPLAAIALPTASTSQPTTSNTAQPQIAQPQIAQPQIAQPQIAQPQIAQPTAADDSPDTAINPQNGKVNIRFVNETGTNIEYQVISDTEPRVLAGRQSMVLEGLPVPSTLTFRRQDFGFLQVSYQRDLSSGTLTVMVKETPDFGSDRTSIYVDPTGKVFFN